MPPFTISEIISSDLPAIVDIIIDSFYKNPRTLSYHKFADGADLYDWVLKHTNYDFSRDQDENLYFKLVDDETGKPIAFTIWKIPRVRGSQAEEAERARLNKEAEDELKAQEVLPAGANKYLMNWADTKTQRVREKYVNSEKDYVLKTISVHPDYWGKGCAGVLIRSGLTMVDAANAKAWLEGTPQGVPVYEKYGWREIDRIVIDVQASGRRQGARVITTIMERTARSALV